MRRLLKRLVLIVTIGTVVSVVSPSARALDPNRSPKLIVLLVVDQMRGDYVDKFQQQWTGGLHRLLTEGAWFRQTDYPYFDTVTCAGHATISTGSYPSVHGMILNAWYDRATEKQVACADDEGTAIVSYGKPLTGPGESARLLRTSTLADELRAQLDPAAHVIAFSLKARSTVTLAGQRADAAAWFDDRGAWVTSSAYSVGPVAAVAEHVKAHPVEGDFGKTWDRTLPKEQYLFESPAIGVTPKLSMTAAFPHVVRGPGDAPDATFYSQWQESPFADEYLAGMALDVAAKLSIGKSGRTDLIGISFSALDKVGHDFGPDSHEIQDVLIRLDRTLAGFFNGLDRLVGRGNYVLALTGDHGVAPIPERARLQGLDGGRLSSSTLSSAIEDALVTLGPGKHVAAFSNADAYLAPGVWTQLRAQPALLSALRTAVKNLPGVLALYTRDELEANHLDDDAIGRRLARSFDAERSGDLVIVLKPYWTFSSTGTNHGTSFGYDTRVPMFLMGKGISAGEYLQPATPADIAPTMAFLAGITLPRAQGRVLTEAITK